MFEVRPLVERFCGLILYSTCVDCWFMVQAFSRVWRYVCGLPVWERFMCVFCCLVLFVPVVFVVGSWMLSLLKLLFV